MDQLNFPGKIEILAQKSRKIQKNDQFWVYMKIKILPFFWWVAEIVSRKERQLVRSQFFSKIRHYRRQFKIFGGLKSDFEKMKNSNFWRCSRDFKIWSRDQQNFQNFEHTFLATIYNLEIFGISWTASDVGDMMLVTWCWWHDVGDKEYWYIFSNL